MSTPSITFLTTEDIRQATTEVLLSYLSEDTVEPNSNIVSTVQELLSGDPDLCAVDKNNNTALNMACEQRLFGAIDLLAEKEKSAFTIFNKRGYAPIHSVIIGKPNKPPSGALTMTQIVSSARQSIHNYPLQSLASLVLHGVDLDLLSAEGTTALHLAVILKKSDLIIELLQLGADPSVRDGKTGQTPLQVAVSKGSLEIVELLLCSKEVQTTINSTNLGNSCLDIAEKATRNPSDKSTSITTVLLSHGARRGTELEANSSEKKQNSEKTKSRYGEARTFSENLQRMQKGLPYSIVIPLPVRLANFSTVHILQRSSAIRNKNFNHLNKLPNAPSLSDKHLDLTKYNVPPKVEPHSTLEREMLNSVSRSLTVPGSLTATSSSADKMAVLGSLPSLTASLSLSPFSFTNSLPHQDSAIDNLRPSMGGGSTSLTPSLRSAVATGSFVEMDRRSVADRSDSKSTAEIKMNNETETILNPAAQTPPLPILPGFNASTKALDLTATATVQAAVTAGKPALELDNEEWFNDNPMGDNNFKVIVNNIEPSSNHPNRRRNS